MATARLHRPDGTQKVALVTGGASGIGRVTALHLAKHGAAVYVADLPSTRPRFDRLIAPADPSIQFVELDVTQEDQWRAALARVERDRGALDVLVNNAGIYAQPEPDLEAQTLEFWRRHFAVNVEGTFLGAKHAVALMARARPPEGAGSYSRSIVNVSSVAGIVGIASLPCYCATKGAIRMFTKAVALQCAEKKYNIRCNSVHPGGVDVLADKDIPPEHLAAARARTDAALTAMHPIGHGGTPEDIASAIVFLASEESSFVTGSEIVVDGGFTAK